MSYPRREEQVRAFHKATEEGAKTNLGQVCDFRIKLIMEEAEEVADAINEYSYFKEPNREHLLKELCDLQYVLSGAVVQFGLANVFEEAFSRVHASNMAKVAFGIKRGPGGKIMKPAGWTVPSLVDLI